MNTKAPDLHPVTSAQFAEEMNSIEVASSYRWGTHTVITGVRHFGDEPRPVVIIKGGMSGMHLIALTSDA